MRRVVIAEDEPITRMDMTEILIEANYEVVGTALDGFDVIEVCRKLKPDLVLMDIKMPLLNGLKASKFIIEEDLAGCVVLVSAYSNKDFIDEAKEVGVMGYLIKPISERELLPALEVALSKNQEIKNMKENIISMQGKLEDRKLIEKAKGLLMVGENISEEEAYNEIRKLSMDKRMSMANISRLIIERER